MQMTSVLPSAKRLAIRLLPIKPAPPVTTALLGLAALRGGLAAVSLVGIVCLVVAAVGARGHIF